VPVGASPDLARVEEELSKGCYGMVVVTHVETSTAVLTRLQPIKEMLDRVAPQTLFVVDAVASLVAEELRFDEWGIDVVVTGSQKAIGCPPGLSIIMVSARALKAAEDREGKPITWYASLPRWLPIMRKYEAKEPSYFATPPTQIVRALKESLHRILARGMEETWRLHREKSALVKKSIASLGLRQLAELEEDQSNAVTAIWVPEGVVAKDLLAKALSKGVMLASGMHKDVGSRYIRFGHMGYSVVGGEGHIETGLRVLTESILEMYNERLERENAAIEAVQSESVLGLGVQGVAVAQG
jgi:alanine-glyoxylate transaminase / serine-glyoxylate transaminase / serine-pyruvate transaminase